MTGHVEDSIKFSLRKNGFPDKKVRLPFKAVYKSCKENDTSLTEVLENLKAEEIFGKMSGDYIEFSSLEKQNNSAKTQAGESPDVNGPADGFGISDATEFEEMAKQAMSNMTPEELDEIKARVDNMSEEEKQNIMKIFSQQFNK